MEKPKTVFFLIHPAQTVLAPVGAYFVFVIRHTKSHLKTDAM
jgi:hypothetical protein